MKKISPFDRILFLITALLAAYQVAIGIDGFDSMAVICYTIALGVLLLACLLIIIFGFEILESPSVVVVSTLIPLSLSLGLVWEYLLDYKNLYLIFTIAGFSAVVMTRQFTPGRPGVIVLAVVHGITGMVIFLLPFTLNLRGETNPGFALVGLGGALIGIGGLLRSFLKTGSPILSREKILTILPVLLLLMTISFVIGFELR